MKKLIILALTALLVGLITGCPVMDVPTALEQVESFIAAANADTRSYSAMQSHFSPDAADYQFLDSEFYWEDDLRFFDLAGRPYSISLTEGGADATIPNSVVVNGTVTSGGTSYTAEFVLVSDPDNAFAPPLIRKIDIVRNVIDPELARVNTFIAAANESLQDYDFMKSQFHPAAADYGSLQLSTYWDFSFFDDADQPFSLANVALGGEEPAFPGSTTVTADITNSFTTDAGLFVLLDNTNGVFDVKLIRELTVGTEVIESIVPY